MHVLPTIVGGVRSGRFACHPRHCVRRLMDGGHHIQAYGYGITFDDSIYYMIGEEKTDGHLFQGVNCYSSPDLTEWSFIGQLVARTEEDGDLGPSRIVERPKVIRNDKTDKYVLYMHIDPENYSDARVGVGTGDSICGKYTYHGNFRPFGHKSRDIKLFKDDDGTGYLLTEDRQFGTRIIKLNEDYLDVEEITFEWEYFAESPVRILCYQSPL